ncbi:MAG TPA: hypothetical protein H9733_05480 [Candidatus Anaerotignum merdipullorum]|nr:hypothetical protein [Candidatus Anaerotignum merdipullorum]
MGKGGGGHFNGTRGSRNSIPSEKSVSKHIFDKNMVSHKMLASTYHLEKKYRNLSSHSLLHCPFYTENGMIYHISVDECIKNRYNNSA